MCSRDVAQVEHAGLSRLSGARPRIGLACSKIPNKLAACSTVFARQRISDKCVTSSGQLHNFGIYHSAVTLTRSS